jgi:hypothetical protein
MNSGMFSIIVPTHKLFKREDGKYEIEACIDSILDQDYKNYEILVVANGPERAEILEVVQKYGDKVRTFLQEEANGNKAKNLGQSYAQGEFYTFFSGDLVMYPGTLTLWKEKFDENPDAAIIYGGYDLMEKGVPKNIRCDVEEFDRHVLESHNLIDGAMPCRAKDFKPWCPEVVALQDWDWALSITDGGAIAKKIPDICYCAEVPKAGGLTDTFNKNWLALNKQIKARHGIPDRKLCVSSLGAPFHGIRTSKILDADFKQMPSQFPHEYDAVYLLGFYLGSSPEQHVNVFARMKPEALRIIHWIGTDILQMWGMTVEAMVNWRRALTEYIDIQFTECRTTQLEMKEMGIRTIVLPLPIDVENFPVLNTKPEKYTVAVYTPAGDETTRKKYNMDLMDDIARACPDINFIFYGDPNYQKQSDNVEVRGWVKIQEVIRDSNVLLRYPHHDGLPITPIEFMLSGRDVICTSQDLMGTFFCGTGRVQTDTYDLHKSTIIKAIRDMETFVLPDRDKYIEWYRKRFSKATFVRKFNRVCRWRKKKVKQMMDGINATKG